MNHPTREELTLHLLGEAPDDVRRRVLEHLRDCPGCAAQLAGWRGTLRRLDAWPLRPATRRSGVFANVPWRWAAAALALGLGGVALGRALGPAPFIQAERQALAAELRQEIRQSLHQFAQQVETGRAEDLRAVRALLVELERRRANDYAALRKDLETVATFTDEELRDARRRLTVLAQLSVPPAEPSNQ
jgi:hypothetical protein